MTKNELLVALKDFPDDWEVAIDYVCLHCEERSVDEVDTVKINIGDRVAYIVN